MTKLRGTLSDRELVDYSREHVLHEIRMLFDTGLLLLDRKYLDKIEPDPFREAARFAVIESFVMHARTLIAFFYPDDDDRKDDVLARCFFDGDQLPSTFPPSSRVLTEVRRRASKEVGHLTTERIAGQPPEKNWPVRQVLEDLRTVLLEFVRGASPSKIHADLEPFVAAREVPLFVVVGAANYSTCSTSPTVISLTWPCDGN
jgi:hypothetical protein